MSNLHVLILATALAATTTSASAQSWGRYGSEQSHGLNRYDIVTFPDVLADAHVAAPGHASGHIGTAHHRIPVIPPAKVMIIDNRTGDLWAWSEAEQTVLYLGYIFPLAGQGPIARVITLPER